MTKTVANNYALSPKGLGRRGFMPKLRLIANAASKWSSELQAPWASHLTRALQT